MYRVLVSKREGRILVTGRRGTSDLLRRAGTSFSSPLTGRRLLTSPWIWLRKKSWSGTTTRL